MTTIESAPAGEPQVASPLSNSPSNEQIFVSDGKWRRVSLAASGWILGVSFVLIAGTVAVGASSGVEPGARPFESVKAEMPPQSQAKEATGLPEVADEPSAENRTNLPKPARTNTGTADQNLEPADILPSLPSVETVLEIPVLQVGLTEDSQLLDPDLGTDDIDPADSDPADLDPADSDPADLDPADSDPADSDPADSDPADSDPADSDPAGPTNNETGL